jgi:hypothetical protein
MAIATTCGNPLLCVALVLSPWVRRAGREADYCRASSIEQEEST